MATSHPSRAPTFLWQGVLILLPVLLLAGVGILSLRHDRLIAEHQAKQRAREVAEMLAPKLWSELALTNVPPEKGIAFLVGTNAELLFPPACAVTPAPEPLELSGLNSNQAQLWTAARAIEAAEQEPARAIPVYGEFVGSEPPAPFAAAAQYSLGLLLANQGQTRDAVQSFEAVVNKYPGSIAESGLPLEPLARLKLLEVGLTNAAGNLVDELRTVEGLCSNAVWRPTQVSPEILRRVSELARSPAARAVTESAQQTWEEHQKVRESYSTLADTGALVNKPVPPGGAFWCLADQAWLVRSVQTSTGTWYSCRTETDLGGALTKIVEREKQLPDYFGVGIDVAGRRLTWPAPELRTWDLVNYFGREGGGQKKEYSLQTATNLLATAEPPGSAGLLKAHIYLTSPGALFARERTRVFWFAALIASAAIAAGVGFVTAFSAFKRQLRLSELKSNFVSSVSHELRAPIASVRLLAESLERGKIQGPPKQREYFAFIVQECRRLSSLVENVLDFSRIEQGRKQYEFEPTDVAALAEQTVKLMQPYAQEKGIRLELQAPSRPSPEVNHQPVLDGKAIQQALVNLIDNAIKHSPKGKLVTVGLEQGTVGESETRMSNPESIVNAPVVPPQQPEAAQKTVRLWVEDQGEGIPPAEHEKIFERFYRRGSELRRESQGVGIGLSIVKHIVEAHGGRVIVRSDVGEGSRFTIELPGEDKPEIRSSKFE